jgi:hypothetical protein
MPIAIVATIAVPVLRGTPARPMRPKPTRIGMTFGIRVSAAARADRKTQAWMSPMTAKV